jgi:hypothetical protein
MNSPGKLIEDVEQIAREFGGHDANLLIMVKRNRVWTGGNGGLGLEEFVEETYPAPSAAERNVSYAKCPRQVRPRPSRVTAVPTLSEVGPSPDSGYWIAPQAQGQGSTILSEMIHSFK